jgi:hypothetical protein
MKKIINQIINIFYEQFYKFIKEEPDYSNAYDLAQQMKSVNRFKGQYVIVKSYISIKFYSKYKLIVIKQKGSGYYNKDEICILRGLDVENLKGTKKSLYRLKMFRIRYPGLFYSDFQKINKKYNRKMKFKKILKKL